MYTRNNNNNLFTGCGQYARYKSVPDRNPSVMKSYSNSLTYVLKTVETRYHTSG